MKNLLPLLAALIALASLGYSADFQKLVQETQRVEQSGNHIDMIWWIPTVFWEEAMKQNPNLTTEQRDAFINVLNDYTVVAVVSTDIGPLGGFKPRPESDVIANTRLEVDGETIDPLERSEISGDATNFFLLMRPLMAQMLGQFGEGMNFIVYPNSKDGVKLIDPTQPSSFSYTSNGVKQTWKLPLASLLPPMYDAASGEQFPGNYKYNPYTGELLVSEKP